MKAKIGIGIIIIAFLVCLNPYLLIFGVPLFIIGIIILLLSDKNLKTKLIWILTPIILWYPSMHLYFYLMGTIGTATAQKLDLIFPENFKGKAIVVSDMPCGEEIKIIDNREQLRIPENGILLYKGNLKSGYINNRYFKIDNNGNKRIADNTLVALTLMIAVSKPEEKDTMTKVIVNLINKKN